MAENTMTSAACKAATDALLTMLKGSSAEEYRDAHLALVAHLAFAVTMMTGQPSKVAKDMANEVARGIRTASEIHKATGGRRG